MSFALGVMADEMYHEYYPMMHADISGKYCLGVAQGPTFGRFFVFDEALIHLA